MVGPSSSHTAGACRIGWAARHIFGAQPESVCFHLHGSFFATGEGHGTREALVAGILGLSADNDDLPKSFDLAAKQSLQFEFRQIDLGDQAHPNSVLIELQKNEDTQSILGASVGGGSIIIQKIGLSEVSLRGGLETLLLWHRDTPGFLARITAVLSCLEINVASIHTSRKERGEDALTVIEIDGHFPPALLELITCIPAVHHHSLLPILPGF